MVDTGGRGLSPLMATYRVPAAQRADHVPRSQGRVLTAGASRRSLMGRQLVWLSSPGCILQAVSLPPGEGEGDVWRKPARHRAQRDPRD